MVSYTAYIPLVYGKHYLTVCNQVKNEIFDVQHPELC